MAETVSQKAKNPKDLPNEDFYSWSTWFSILSGQATDDDKRRYRLARDVVREATDCQRCEKHRDWTFENSWSPQKIGDY
jgi:mitochondrial inner membrane protease ATP23